METKRQKNKWQKFNLITGIKGQNVKNVATPFRNANGHEIKTVYNMALKQLCLVLENNGAVHTKARNWPILWSGLEIHTW